MKLLGGWLDVDSPGRARRGPRRVRWAVGGLSRRLDGGRAGRRSNGALGLRVGGRTLRRLHNLRKLCLCFIDQLVRNQFVFAPLALHLAAVRRVQTRPGLQAGPLKRPRGSRSTAVRRGALGRRSARDRLPTWRATQQVRGRAVANRALEREHANPCVRPSHRGPGSAGCLSGASAPTRHRNERPHRTWTTYHRPDARQEAERARAA